MGLLFVVITGNTRLHDGNDVVNVKREREEREEEEEEGEYIL